MRQLIARAQTKGGYAMRYRGCLSIGTGCVLLALASCGGDHGWGYYPPPIPTGDGLAPDALIQGSDGNFYGTTASGGANGLGTLFKVTPAGVETLVYSFAGGAANGATPQTLLQGSDGNFYGVTGSGGSGPCQDGCGSAFKITPTGVQTGLYFFSGGADGGQPSDVIQGSDGNLYGTTAYGGVANNACGAGGCGVAFKLTTAGAESTLYSFSAGTADGGLPVGITQGTDGNFYGTTTYGGSANNGTVVRITPAGVETVLHSFAGGNDGANPQGPLIQGKDGNFYGTTTYGGTANGGTVFKISAAGVETVLYSFAGGSTDGANPYTSLVQGTDGNFYGTTNAGGDGSCIAGCGAVFKVTPTGTESVVYFFTAAMFGGPQPPTPSSLLQGSDGNFYGTTLNGGQYGGGAFFKVTPAGAATLLYSFGTNNP
jgi:uncharacterized repeat protein (TIGR03803 family)